MSGFTLRRTGATGGRIGLPAVAFGLLASAYGANIFVHAAPTREWESAGRSIGAHLDVGNSDSHVRLAVALRGLTPIHEIQGAAHLSPLWGSQVTTRGTVTARDSNGFYIQGATSDLNPATSEGIFVFTGGVPSVTVGDDVEVTAFINEYRPGSNGLSITELISPQIVVLSSGNPLPTPVIIGSGGRQPPHSIIDNDSPTAINIETDPAADFDPAVDGIDFYESLEGMLVQIDNPVAIAPTKIFGSGGPGNVEVYVVGDGGAAASPRTNRGGLHILADDFNPERVILNNRLQSLRIVDTGATYSGSIIGVMTYNFGKYLFLPVQPLPTPAPSTLEREGTHIVGDASTLTVATFNVLNLDPNDSDGDPDLSSGHFDGIADVIKNRMGAPDIIGLEEIQDNSGAVNDGTTAADVTYAELISRIAAGGGPVYDVRQIDPVNGMDGGQPGANIRVAFLFRPDRVTFVDRGGAGPLVAAEVVAGPNGPQLSLSPGRIDPTNSAFINSRKPLAGEFLFGEERVFVVVNHFNSKSGDDPLWGFNQPPV